MSHDMAKPNDFLILVTMVLHGLPSSIRRTVIPWTIASVNYSVSFTQQFEKL